MSRLDDILKSSTARWGTRPAIAWEDCVLTYRQLNDRVDRLAQRLSPDIAPGQRVGVLAPNAPSFAVSMFAVWRCGGAAVPLNVRWREFELQSTFRDAELTALLCARAHGQFSFAELVSNVAAALPTLRRALVIDPMGEVQGEIVGRAPAQDAHPMEDGIGVIHYTSGTTGRPKGVVLHEQTPARGGAALAEVLQSDSADVALLVLPLSHAFGLLTLLATLVIGGLGVLVSSTFSLARLLEAMRDHAATLVHGSPALFTSLLAAAPGELSARRTGLVGGTICPARLLQALDQAGLTLLNSFGMTEIGPATSCRLDDAPHVRHETVGRPLEGYEFRIVGGPVGDVEVKSPYVMRGYFRQREESAAAFDGPWFRTGDIGSIDEQGYLRISGRTTEVIHVAGLKVFPAEVENCLLTHPDVAEAVVVGVPHATMGEAPAAFVVPRGKSNIQPHHLLQFARRSIAGYKVPYLIQLVSELPCLATGKPDRATLAHRLKEEHHARADARSQPPV